MVDSSLVENVCTGNIWVVDNTYVRPIIGIWHHWHSSVITDCIFGVSPRKSDINEVKECSNCWTLNRILTMGQSEVTKRWSLSGRILVPYANYFQCFISVLHSILGFIFKKTFFFLLWRKEHVAAKDLKQAESSLTNTPLHFHDLRLHVVNKT